MLEKDVPQDLNIVVEADPFALLPVDACAPGETLLYIEDFQDNEAQGWQEIQYNAPGWALVEEPNQPANLVASAQYYASTQNLWSRLEGQNFENAAWRLRFMPTGRFSQQDYVSFNWLHANEPFDLGGTDVFDSRYQIPVGFNYFGMQRLQQPVTNFGVGNSPRLPLVGEWNLIEIGTFDGSTEVWLNGTRLFAYKDQNPLPPGTIGFEAILSSENAPSLYFDNLSVCQLSAPFAPMPTEE